ncbi:hypothetical protein [Deinococcus puniceus]|uniref:Uncharacterized protein n=1 Tax=Deinococcus puniceus TaxID=1182568 RepID=A0A172TB99_9DEIO|nr:hypothetical protein [Deinococcus puniceus]ANE44325.1 hypothetical protein SU48_11740 [Deinococcus puniceus]
MKYGFDPELFQLQRIPTPEWAVQGVTYGERQAELEKILETSSGEIIQQSQDFLQWALTDPVAVAKFQPFSYYSEGVNGNYFVGCRHLEFSSEQPSSILVETELSLTRIDYKNLPSVYTRYLVTLLWNPTTKQGQSILAHDTDYDSKISNLKFKLVRTLTVGEIARGRLSDEDYLTLEHRWPEVLACLQEAAMEAVNDGSGSGHVDDNFFPSRLELTGEYYISDINSSDDSFMTVMLHFLGHANSADQQHDDYLGYDLALNVPEDGPLTYELWGSSSI